MMPCPLGNLGERNGRQVRLEEPGVVHKGSVSRLTPNEPGLKQVWASLHGFYGGASRWWEGPPELVSGVTHNPSPSNMGEKGKAKECERR